VDCSIVSPEASERAARAAAARGTAFGADLDFASLILLAARDAGMVIEPERD
jgi:hypothetical protein